MRELDEYFSVEDGDAFSLTITWHDLSSALAYEAWQAVTMPVRLLINALS